MGHTVSPMPGPYLPGAQYTQLALLVALRVVEKVPLPQRTHPDIPDPVWNFPGSQATHELCPELAA